MIISLGVFIGNVATIGVERGVAYWEIHQVAKVMETETVKMKLRMDAQEKINREKAISRNAINREQTRATEIENQMKQAGLR